MLKKSLSAILAFAVVLSTIICGPMFSASAETDAIYVDAVTLKSEDASEYGFADFAYVDQTGADYEVTVDPEYMYKIINGLALNSNLPESYDSKEYGYVTSVKNQGASGNCWSFSMMSALESNGITEGIADENTNLSEAHHVWFTGNSLATDESDPTYGDGITISSPYTTGGNWLWGTHTLARWSGAANNSEFPFYPYSLSSMGNYSEENRYDKSSGIVIKSTEVLLDDADVKNWIKENGSATVEFCYDDSYLYNDEAYYCYDKGLSSNHIVTIVGWDDTYSYSNFNPDDQPSASGAWLCKNSWGTDWGDSGYFWLSYMDESISEFIGFTSQSSETYNKNHTYNGAPWRNFLGLNDTASVANVFKTDAYEETLSAISVYTITPGQQLNISVYTDMASDYSDPTAGTLALEHSTTIAREGYHTIELPSEVALNPDSYFSVVVEYVNTDDIARIPVEIDGTTDFSYSSQLGQSFVYLPEYYSSWKNTENVYTYDSEGNSYSLNNVYVQAFTKCDIPEDETNTPEDENSLKNGDIIEFGSYPQSKVTDEALLAELNALTLDWTYYEYYAGTDTAHPNVSSVGSMARMDYVKYCDVELNGEKYRAVYMEKYRPTYTTMVPISNNTLLDDLGYSLNTVYWYKFEPLTWIVLDPVNGVVISEKILDSQPFNNTSYRNNNDNLFYSDKNYTNFADDYATSSLRTWLNETFVSTAFNSEELSLIETSNVECDGVTVNDFVYILSAEEATNTAYGFNSDPAVSDALRTSKITQYAHSQSCYSGSYCLRTKGGENFEHQACSAVNGTGKIGKNFLTNANVGGVRPVIKFDTDPSDEPATDIPYAVEIYTMNTSGEYEAVTETYKGTEGDTAEYSCDIPDGFTLNEEKSTLNGIVSVSEPLTLKVYIDRNIYTLTTTVDGISKTEELYYEETIPEKVVPSKEYYNFVEWSPAIPEKMPCNNIESVAVFEPCVYTVTFVADGNTVKTESYTVENKNIDIPDVPEKEGHSGRWESFELDCTDITVSAVYEKNSYTVTWHTGFEVISESYEYGADIVEPSVEADGYSFNGWDKQIPDTIPAENLYFTGSWTPNVYTVTWIADGEETVVEVIYNSQIPAPETPVKKGHSFKGWDNEVPSLMPSCNLVFTAEWEANKYNVSFNANGGYWSNGASIITESVEYGSKIPYPETPSKQGYVFGGWDKNPVTMGDADITVTAIWTPSENTVYTVETYTMGIDGKYGNPVVTKSYGTTDTVAAVTPDNKEGFEIADESVLSGTITADGELVLKVYYNRNQYTVNYMVDNKSYDEAKVYYYGADVEMLAEPAKEGYTFSGWDSTVTTMPANNMTVSGTFTVNQYNAVFCADGEIIATVPTNYGEIPVAPTSTKTGYTFVEWSPALTAMGVGGAEYYAVFRANDGIAYTVETYQLATDGVTYEKTDEETLYGVAGDTATAATPVIEGFTYNANISTITGEIAGDGSLVLKVYYDRVKNEVTINGTTAEYYYGESIPEPEKPEAPEGYEQNGWVDENGNAVVFPITVNENIPSEIKPSFVKCIYTVKWFIDGTVIEESYEFEDAINKPDAPEKKGYVFKGWTPEIPDNMPAYNLEFTAVFEKITYTCQCGEKFDDEATYNAHIAYESAIKAARVTIKNNPEARTIKYGETLRLTAVADFVPEGAIINWYVGDKLAGTGETFDYTYEYGSDTVKVVLEYSEGNPVNSECSDSEEVKVNSGFFVKIISFFKKLFGINQLVKQ